MNEEMLSVISNVSIEAIIIVIRKIHDIMDLIFDSNQHDIKNKIINLDLADKLKEIEAFIIDLQTINIEKIGKQSLVISIHSLHKSIELIHKSLESLSTSLLEHKEKFFSIWISFDSHYDQISKYDALLNMRYKRVKDLMKIQWN